MTQDSPRETFVSTKLMAAVNRWCSWTAESPRLNRVFLLPNELVACDGRRMVRVPAEIAYQGSDPPPYPFAIPATLVDAAVVAAGAAERLATWYENRRTHVKVGPINLSERNDFPDMPNWDKVIPAEVTVSSPPTMTFDLRFLADIVPVLAAANGDTYVKITSWGGALDPMVFRSKNGIRFVVMPCR